MTGLVSQFWTERILPDQRNLRVHRLFAFAYYGEILSLVFNGIAVIRMTAIDLKLASSMMSFMVLRSSLIWAWGRRYPGVDWVYSAWNLPALILLVIVGTSSSFGAFLSAGVSPRGIQIGDGVILLWGFMAIIIAVVSRGIGLWWCIIEQKTIEFAETSRMPAIVIASLIIGVTGYLMRGYRVLDFIAVIGMAFYGLGISI